MQRALQQVRVASRGLRRGPSARVFPVCLVRRRASWHVSVEEWWLISIQLLEISHATHRYTALRATARASAAGVSGKERLLSVVQYYVRHTCVSLYARHRCAAALLASRRASVALSSSVCRPES